MDAATTRLLLELVVYPAIKRLAEKRNLHLSTKEIKEIADNPKPLLLKIKANDHLRKTIIEEIIDGADAFCGRILDTIATAIKRLLGDSTNK